MSRSESREASTGWDFIVVGAGAAGCVVASRLLELEGAHVLLLEQGRSDSNPLLRMPAGFIKMINGHRDVEIHESVPQPALDGRVQTIPQGVVLGGSTSVNAMVYMRGRKAEYDHWAELTGDSGWNWDSMLRHFIRQEGNTRLNNEHHGPDGPLKVSDTNFACEMSYLFVKALQELGHPFTHDFNVGRPSGVGFMQYTIDRGRRCSAVDAHLRPVTDDPRLSVRTGATAVRIELEGGRARAVTYLEGGTAKVARADCEVIVTAGAFITPKLLMLSGIGDPDELSEVGIETQVKLRGVGKNLQDHHEVPVFATTHRKIGYFGEDRGLKMLVNGLQYLLFRSGPVSTIGVEATAFVMPDETGDPVMQMFCIPSAYLDRDIGGVKPKPGVTLNALLLRPKARGWVRLRSSDPRDLPLIHPNFLGHPDDLELEIAGLKFARDILRTRILAGEIDCEVLPGSGCASDEDLAAHCRRTVKTGYHPVGTCRMGASDDADAVLTPDLRVKGVEGLRVADASMMPVLVSANTNAPTQAIADRAADLIIACWT